MTMDEKARRDAVVAEMKRNPLGVLAAEAEFVERLATDTEAEIGHHRFCELGLDELWPVYWNLKFVANELWTRAEMAAHDDTSN